MTPSKNIYVVHVCNKLLRISVLIVRKDTDDDNFRLLVHSNHTSPQIISPTGGTCQQSSSWWYCHYSPATLSNSSSLGRHSSPVYIKCMHAVDQIVGALYRNK